MKTTNELNNMTKREIINLLDGRKVETSRGYVTLSSWSSKWNECTKSEIIEMYLGSIEE